MFYIMEELDNVHACYPTSTGVILKHSLNCTA